MYYNCYYSIITLLWKPYYVCFTFFIISGYSILYYSKISGQMIDMTKENIFSDIFQTIWRTGAKFEALFKLATCSNYSITNYVKFPMFYFFEKENK